MSPVAVGLPVGYRTPAAIPTATIVIPPPAIRDAARVQIDGVRGHASLFRGPAEDRRVSADAGPDRSGERARGRAYGASPPLLASPGVVGRPAGHAGRRNVRPKSDRPSLDITPQVRREAVDGSGVRAHGCGIREG